MAKPGILLAWSGGKDSALALRELRSDGARPVAGLLTTVTAEYGRVSMHGVRVELLRRQAEAIGLPLEEVVVSAAEGEDGYARNMRRAMDAARARGVEAVAFGDLHLADVRAYRQQRLAEAGMEAVFPLWGRDPAELAEGFIAAGSKAVLTCVDGRVLDGGLAGRDFDRRLLADLPEGVDPCGENGEFHTFVWDAPGFARPVGFRRGEVVLREGKFHFCDLLPE